MNKPASMLFKKHKHLILTEVPLFCVCAHAFLTIASYIYFFFFFGGGFCQLNGRQSILESQ